MSRQDSRLGHEYDHEHNRAVSINYAYSPSLKTKLIDSQTTIKCRHCDIMLSGRDQFIGHMIHSHEFRYETVNDIWTTLSASTITNLNNGF